MKFKKNAVVVHSGGMDSSICLKLAVDEFGAKIHAGIAAILVMLAWYCSDIGCDKHGNHLANWGVEYLLDFSNLANFVLYASLVTSGGKQSSLNLFCSSSVRFNSLIISFVK